MLRTQRYLYESLYRHTPEGYALNKASNSLIELRISLLPMHWSMAIKMDDLDWWCKTTSQIADGETILFCQKMGDDYQTTKETKCIFCRDITEWSFQESHHHCKQTGELCLFETPPVHEQVATEPATSSNKDMVSSVQWKPVAQSVVTGKDPLHTPTQVPVQVEEPPTPSHEGVSVVQKQLKVEATKEPADEHGCRSQHVSNSNYASVKHLSLLPSPTASSQPTLPRSIHHLSSITHHQWQLPILSLLNYRLDFLDIQ